VKPAFAGSISGNETERRLRHRRASELEMTVADVQDTQM